MAVNPRPLSLFRIHAAIYGFPKLCSCQRERREERGSCLSTFSTNVKLLYNGERKRDEEKCVGEDHRDRLRACSLGLYGGGCWDEPACRPHQPAKRWTRQVVLKASLSLSPSFSLSLSHSHTHFLFPSDTSLSLSLEEEEEQL